MQKKLPKTEGAENFADSQNSAAEALPEAFSEEIRQFKTCSRAFHEFIAETEAKHNPRSLNGESDKNILAKMVAYACGTTICREESNEKGGLSLDEQAEVDAIVDKIVSVSSRISRNSNNLVVEVVYLTMYVYKTKESSVVPLFKVYGNKCDENVYIAKNRCEHNSLLSYVDDCDLPHSLVCASREGSEKTYEIDPKINKYPLAFFTVRYDKGISRASQHSNEFFSFIIRKGFTSVLPPVKSFWDSVWSLVILGFRHFAVQVKYYLNDVNYNATVSTSTKAKFLKFLEKIVCYIKMFDTVQNFVLCSVFAFFKSDGFQGNVSITQLVQSSLLMNGNVFTTEGSKFYNLFTYGYDRSSLINPNKLPQTNILYLWFEGKEILRQLISQFKRPSLKLENLIKCGSLIADFFNLCVYVAQSFTNAAILSTFRCVCHFVKLLSVISLHFIKKPKNEIDGRLKELEAKAIARLTDGDFSLETFAKMKEEGLIPSRGESARSRKMAVEKYATESEVNTSQMCRLHTFKNTDLYAVEGPISVTIEKLLEDLHNDAGVYVRHNNFYEILSEGKLLKIYSHESGLNFIYVERNKENVSTSHTEKEVAVRLPSYESFSAIEELSDQ